MTKSSVVPAKRQSGNSAQSQKKSSKDYVEPKVKQARKPYKKQIQAPPGYRKAKKGERQQDEEDQIKRKVGRPKNEPVMSDSMRKKKHEDKKRTEQQRYDKKA